MTWWKRLVKRDVMERQLDAELRFHFDAAVEDNLRAGMSEPEAHRSVRLRFGGLEQVKEECRDARGFQFVHSLLQDVRYAFRGMRRSPGFTIVAVVMLALAIGLNATIFTVVDAMLFRGYPLVRDNDRLLYLQERPLRGLSPTSYLDFDAWRSQARAFEGMAFVASAPITFSDGDGRSIDLTARTLSANAFGLLRIRPIVGRDFLPADEIPGAPPVAILDYGFWESRLGKRADIAGLTVHINGVPATIIGVMPEGFAFPGQENLWMPLSHTTELYQKNFRGFFVLGRLRDGVTLHSARAEIDTINRRLDEADRVVKRSGAPTVFTYSQFYIGPDAPMIYGSLWAAAWFVLLIACANLANLTLARTIGRWQEFSTRIALGAGEVRIMRQIFVESLILATFAGALGWGITKWSVGKWAVETVSRFQVLDYTVDSGTLAYLVAISIAAAILLSLAPIGRVLQLGLDSALKGDARGVTQGLRGKHLAAVLVAGQMTLAIVLLSGAGVLARSLLNVVKAETGVRNPENILVGSIRLPSEKYPSPAARLGYFDRLEAKVRAIPGIEDESIASTIPVNNPNAKTFEIEERPKPPEGEEYVAFLRVGSDYFRVVGASAISGRDFNDGDRMAALPVAIVNQSFAAKFWPGEQPVGKRIRATDSNQPGEWLTVVGVVPNIMQGDPTRQHFNPLVYVPFRQEPAARVAFFLVRTSVPPDNVARAVRAEAQKMDPDVLLEDFSTLKASFAFRRDRMDLEHAEMNKHAAVAPILALIALLLAAIGLYAVIVHSVSQRTKEIGVRMAIGAAAENIRSMVLREGMLPVVIGLILGLAASLAVNRILQSQLVGVSPYDPVTMVGAPVVLIVVALLACSLPARRATRINPMEALRCE